MIDILLATYNGERHLTSQIHSILSQTHREWRLLIHDDGSRDGTVEVVRKYLRRYPERIVFLDDDVTGLGAQGNFAHLMAHSSAEYIMFCDQDDVWLPEKVERSWQTLRRAEAATPSIPLGVFGDLMVVDEDLVPLARSMWEHLKVGPWLAQSIRHLAVRTCLTGCTMMINRAALELSLPLPPEAVMHDWWVGLSILKHGGQLVPMAEPVVLYRQHAANVVGASAFSALGRAAAAARIGDFLWSQERIFRMARASGAMTSRMAFALAKGYVLMRSMTGRGCGGDGCACAAGRSTGGTGVA